MQNLYINYAEVIQKLLENKIRESHAMEMHLSDKQTPEYQFDFPVIQKLYRIYQARTRFSQIKKIPYQAPLTQLGPQKCTFWKNAFLGPKYQC